MSSHDMTVHDAQVKQLYLEQLQHGLANLRPHAGLQQLILQSHRLAKVGVRLTQYMV